jgi:hypothetical protein
MIVTALPSFMGYAWLVDHWPLPPYGMALDGFLKIMALVLVFVPVGAVGLLVTRSIIKRELSEALRSESCVRCRYTLRELPATHGLVSCPECGLMSARLTPSSPPAPP